MSTLGLWLLVFAVCVGRLLFTVATGLCCLRTSKGGLSVWVDRVTVDRCSRIPCMSLVLPVQVCSMGSCCACKGRVCPGLA